MVIDPQPDVKQMPFGVVQTVEIHRHTQLHAPLRDVFELLLFKGGGVGFARQAVGGTANSQQMPGQVATVNR